MCGLLECDIPLPRKADLVSIEASDLHPDPQQKNLLVLVATLKNRAPFAGLPAPGTDADRHRDQPMVRKVLRSGRIPGARRGRARRLRRQRRPGGQSRLDAGDVGASGYRLYLFYP
jgi:hypothetical protein